MTGQPQGHAALPATRSATRPRVCQPLRPASACLPAPVTGAHFGASRFYVHTKMISLYIHKRPLPTVPASPKRACKGAAADVTVESRPAMTTQHKSGDVSDRNRLRPLPHQVTALAEITRALAVGDRTLLVSACGTGKTLTGRWHAQAADVRLAVVFVPSLALVAQTLGEWRRAADLHWPYEALVVCSDASTAEGAAERAAEEGGAVDYGFWARARASVTTDPGRAAAALRAAAGPRGHRLVVFSTYHSAPVVAAACQAADAVFDLAICDEAHRLAGRPRDSFRAVLDDRRVPARKRLFMTATPQVDDGDGVLSMDDPALFGPRCHTVTFAQAIDAGMLADYQVLVIADQRVADGRSHRTGKDARAVPGAVLAATAAHHLRSMLSFHTYVADATAFADLLDGITMRNGRVIRTQHVNSRHRGAQRAATLRWLGEDTGGQQMRLVSSARCLEEGVDVPAVDSVLFADPRKAVIGIIQASGRALRAAPGKTTATIIVPVTLPDTGGDDDTDLTVSEFGHVWMVLRALRAHDERFACEIDAAAEAFRRSQPRLQRAGGPRRHLHRVRFILPPGTTLDENLLRLRMVEALSGDASWERFYTLLCDYAQATDGALLPFNKTWQDAGLGLWAFRQIAAYNAGLMPPGRVARLEAVPGWAWNREDGHFAENVRRLRQLATSRPAGLAQPAAGPSIYKGLKESHYRRPLGETAADYRQRYRDGMLPDDQAAQLDALPGWDWTGGLPADDVAMLQGLRLFCEFEHHADVPDGHIANDLRLGAWVAAVRRRKLTGRLHPALADEIAAATRMLRGPKGQPAFKWMHAETQWRLAYMALRHFAAREGHAKVPAFHVERLPDAQVQLGQWCGLQRFKRRHGELDPQHKVWLDAVPGWDWDPAGRRGEFGEPLDLGDPKWHGRAKGIQAGCKCELCMTARRVADRQWLRERKAAQMLALGGAMSAGPARRHLAKLEHAGATRGVLAEVTGVPLGVIRAVANGTTDLIARQHDGLIRATTLKMVDQARTRTGSRGRLASVGGERIPIGPTRELLADLAARGFGASWVTRELGYATTNFLGPDSAQVTRRVAERVAALHARVGDLVAPRAYRNQRVPRLAELLRARNSAEAS